MLSLLFNMLSSFVIAFLPRRKHILISWLQSLSAVILEPKNKISHYSFPIYLPWSDETRCHNFSFFECWVLYQLFHSPISPSSGGSLVPLHFLLLGKCHLFIWGYWYFCEQSWFQLVIHPVQHFTWCCCYCCCYCCCSVTQSYPTIWDPMDCTTPGFFFPCYLP